MVRKSKTVWIILAGGIGNQLFIYAAGLYFSAVTGRKVVFDTSELNHGVSFHASDLRNLSASGRFKALRAMRVLRHLASRLRFFSPIAKFINGVVYESPKLGFDDQLSRQKTARFVLGYFQTWKYLEHPQVRSKIQELKPLTPSDWYLELLQEIKKTNSIAIHIRRGDYKNFSTTFGVLEITYFQEAIRNAILESKRDYSKFYVFSDEIADVKSNGYLKDFGIPVVYVESPEKASAEEELLLMASANCIIISNSTYSWWAAQLGNREKRVFYPSKWFKDHEIPNDLFPSNWQPIGSRWTN